MFCLFSKAYIRIRVIFFSSTKKKKLKWIEHISLKCMNALSSRCMKFSPFFPCLLFPWGLQRKKQRHTVFRSSLDKNVSTLTFSEPTSLKKHYFSVHENRCEIGNFPIFRTRKVATWVLTKFLNTHVMN